MAATIADTKTSSEKAQNNARTCGRIIFIIMETFSKMALLSLKLNKKLKGHREKNVYHHCCCYRHSFIHSSYNY